MEDHEVDLRVFLGILRRRAILIASIFVFCLAIGVCMALLLPARYSSTALLRVDPRQDDGLGPEINRSAGLVSENARIESEVEILRAAPTFARVIENQDVDLAAAFPERPTVLDRLFVFLGMTVPDGAKASVGPERRLDQVARAVDVERRSGTYIIAVTATTETPLASAQLANAVANAHMQLQLETSALELLNTIETVAPHLAMLRSPSWGGNAGASEASAANPFQSGAGKADLATHLQHQRDAVRQARDLMARLTRADRALDAQDFVALSEALGAPDIGEWAAQRDDILAQAAKLPLVGRETSALEAELAEIEDRLNNAVAAELDQMRELLGGGDISLANYEQMLSRLEDMIVRIELQQADSRIVSWAIAPLYPSSRGLLFYLTLSALIGLGLGVAAAMLRENYLSGIVSEEQLALLTGREVATSIPAMKQGHADAASASAPVSLSDAVVSEPLSRYAESIRRLRLGLDLRLPVSRPERRGRVIVVSSAVAKEGKTTSALALARTYALSGARVLIIDADLRRPSLFIHLDAAPVAGLVDYLTGALAPERFPSAIKPDPLTSLSAVVNTRPGDGPTEHLLAGDSFASLVSAARDAFDIIILDTPPLTTVVDAAYALKFADAVVYLTRYARTRQRDVLRALSIIHNARLDLPPVLMAITGQPEKAFSPSDRYVSHYVVVQ